LLFAVVYISHVVMVVANFIELVIIVGKSITLRFLLLQVSIPSRADKLLEISAPKPTQMCLVSTCLYIRCV